MKKLALPFIIALLTVSFSFTSCEKDKLTKENSFTFNNVDHGTSHGYKIMLVETETTSSYYVFLCSEGIQFSLTEDVTGYGDIIVFGLISDSPTDLISGQYVFDDNLVTAFAILGYDSDLGEGIEYDLDPVGASSVKLNVSGTTYELDYSLTLETGKVLKGYYKGSLQELTPPAVKSNKLYFFER
jgi:hypothetical protein